MDTNIKMNFTKSDFKKFFIWVEKLWLEIMIGMARQWQLLRNSKDLCSGLELIIFITARDGGLVPVKRIQMHYYFFRD